MCLKSTSMLRFLFPCFAIFVLLCRFPFRIFNSFCLNVGHTFEMMNCNAIAAICTLAAQQRILKMKFCLFHSTHQTLLHSCIIEPYDSSMDAVNSVTNWERERDSSINGPQRIGNLCVAKGDTRLTWFHCTNANALAFFTANHSLSHLSALFFVCYFPFVCRWHLPQLIHN